MAGIAETRKRRRAADRHFRWAVMAVCVVVVVAVVLAWLVA